jgi:predicted nucleotidyltransferase
LLSNDFGLDESVIQSLALVFSRYARIGAVLLYGSRASGDYRLDSDIDLTIMGDELSEFQLLQLASEIEDLALTHYVDLSLFNEIDSPELLAHIKQVGRMFYRAPLDA